MPEIPMPQIKFPNVDFDKAAADLNNALKEAAYVAVGLGVLGFQKAQVQRVELAKRVAAPEVEALRAQVSELAKTVDRVVRSAVGLR